MNRRWRLILGAGIAAVTAIVLVWLLLPRHRMYYTDGLAIREAARDADLRLVLWEKPSPLAHGINTLPNNIEPVISNDGRMLVFARGKAKQNTDLFFAEWDGEAWSEPRPVENVNTPHDELGPALNPDANLLYFYSDRPEGEGHYDIWVSSWTGSSWDKPRPLGPAVNSPFNEYDPAVDPGGGLLYFASDRPREPEIGEARKAAWQATLRERVFVKDYDIFTAQGVPPAEPELKPKSEDWHPDYQRGVPLVFAPAQRLDVLNTPADEGQIAFTRRGDFLYFSSNREGGLGGFDIYRARRFDGDILFPERVGPPVSSRADDMDPALWLEGHSLLFSSNRDDPEGHAFTLFQSTSREVVARFDDSRLALLWQGLKTRWWWGMMFLLTLLALVFLLRYLLEARRQGNISLTAKCFVGSILVHVLLLFLLSLWFLTTVIMESSKGPMLVQINDAALAREKMSLDLREEVTELKTMRTALPEPRRVVRVERPSFQPAKQVEKEHLLQAPTPREFVVDVPLQENSVPVDSQRPQPAESRDLPALEFTAMTGPMEMPELTPVAAAEPEFEAPRETVLDKQTWEAVETSRPESAPIPSDITLADMQPADFLPAELPSFTALELEAALPEVTLPEALPMPDVAGETSPMETRELETPSESPEPAPDTSSALEVSKQAVESPPAQPVSLTAPVDLVLTQSVARTVLEMDGLMVPSAPLEPVDIPLTPQSMETQVPSVELSMEAWSQASPHQPEPETVLRKPVENLAARAESTPSPSAPVRAERAMETAALPDAQPLEDATVTPWAEIPAAIDLAGDFDQVRTELPEFKPGSNIKLESTPLTRMTYLLRDPVTRERMVEQLGGSEETEAAISRALGFLQRTQEPDGHWDMPKQGGEQGHEVAATGLAILCFMGHGATHLQDGPYRENLRKAVDWLKARQGEDGRFEAKDMYDQGIAGIALAEAYALTEDPALEPVVIKACAYIIEAQHKETGGWRYSPKETGDTSVFGWELMALKSASMAGIELPAEVFRKADLWLKSVGGGQQGGWYGYQDKSPKVALVAEGMFCRQLMGHGPHEPVMAESAEYLNTHLPHTNKRDYYYWYYGCLSLYQHQGPIWETWNSRMREILVNTQDRQGDLAGSWSPQGDPHGNRMGRVVTTALATLSLEVYYRYLPMYGGLQDGQPGGQSAIR